MRVREHYGQILTSCFDNSSNWLCFHILWIPADLSITLYTTRNINYPALIQWLLLWVNLLADETNIELCNDPSLENKIQNKIMIFIQLDIDWHCSLNQSWKFNRLQQQHLQRYKKSCTWITRSMIYLLNVLRPPFCTLTLG